MQIAFLKGENFVNKLIQWWTFSKYSHCEIIFSNGITFGSSTTLPFKTEFSHKGHPSNRWDFIQINLTSEQESFVYEFCTTQVNKEYDWKAIFLSMILPIKNENPDKWICSELCVAALQKAGYFTNIKPCSVSPGKLYRMLKSEK